MSIKQLSEETAREIIETIHVDAGEAARITPIIEKVLLDVTQQMRVECTDVVNDCCPADQDLAHKIADELMRKEALLVSNLMSMR